MTELDHSGSRLYGRKIKKCKIIMTGSGVYTIKEEPEIEEIDVK